MSKVDAMMISSMLAAIAHDRYKLAIEKMRAAFHAQEKCQAGVDFTLNYIHQNATTSSAKSLPR